MTLRSVSVVGLAVAGLVLAGVGPAQAAPEQATGSASIGSVDGTFDGTSVQVAPRAECSTTGVEEARSPSYEMAGFFEFGPGRSTCSLSDNGVARARARGTLFRLDALRPYGGPRIRMTDYRVRCNTTKNGSSASFDIGGLTGLSVPPTLPPNYVVTVPGPGPGAEPLAEITLNEIITPDPADGSMTVNIMHIHLFPDDPDGSPGGEIIVGTASCAPF